MNKTKQWYNDNALSYIETSTSEDMRKGINPLIDQFIETIKENSGNNVLKILDVGCGSGRDAFEFAKRRCLVEAFDQSVVLIEEATKKANMLNLDNPNFSCHSFSEFSGVEKYHGIWACASLLHVETEEFPNVLEILSESLNSGGVFYFSIKKIPDEKMHYSDSERDFFRPQNGTLPDLFERLNLKLVSFFETGKVNDPLQTFENYFLIKK